MDQPIINGGTNTEFIGEKKLKSNLHLVEFVDTIFPVYKKNNCGLQKTSSLLSNGDSLKWYR